MKKGIIFDMDGTLWDSAENVAKSWCIALQECGYGQHTVTREDMYRVMGKTMDEIARELFPFVQGEERDKLLQSCCVIENDYLKKWGGELYPQLRSTMEMLKEEYHLYIVSNCQAGYIEAFLEYYQFYDLFEDIECFGNNGFVKGKNIRQIVQRNHLDKAVYVGDIQGDYEATKEAGVPFIHAAYGFGTIDTPVPKICSLQELVKVAGTIL